MRALQACKTTHKAALDSLRLKQEALAALQKQSAQDTSGDVSELSPDVRNTLARRGEDVASATSAVEQSARELADAETEGKTARAAVLEPWQKTQIYWTKGIDATLDGLLAARAAGLPIGGILRLYDPSKEETADGNAQDLIAQVLHRQQQVPWDDPVLEIAAVQVPIGQPGSPFTPPEATLGESSGSPPATGAPEVQAALHLLERAAGKHSAWKQQQKLYKLERGVADQRIYSRLLDSVRTEQVSVPVIIHCMLEQVACSVLGDTSEGADGAVLEAAKRFDSAMQLSLGLDSALKEKSVGPHDFYTVMEGDTVDMAAHGIVSGYVRPHCTRAPRTHHLQIVCYLHGMSASARSPSDSMHLLYYTHPVD